MGLLALGHFGQSHRGKTRGPLGVHLEHDDPQYEADLVTGLQIDVSPASKMGLALRRYAVEQWEDMVVSD